MVKAYLRYEHAARYGVVASSGCNVSIDREGRTLYCGSLEDVNGWSIRQGVLVRAKRSLHLPLLLCRLHTCRSRACAQSGFVLSPFVTGFLLGSAGCTGTASLSERAWCSTKRCFSFRDVHSEALYSGTPMSMAGSTQSMLQPEEAHKTTNLASPIAGQRAEAGAPRDHRGSTSGHCHRALALSSSPGCRLRRRQHPPVGHGHCHVHRHAERPLWRCYRPRYAPCSSALPCCCRCHQTK
jgi:hypothetical protein